MEEADGDRLVAAGVQRRQQAPAHVGNIERRLDGAVGKDAFRNLEGSGAGHHRRGVLVFEIIDARTTMALQSQDIAKTLGGDKCRRKALALQYRIGGNGRPVREVLDRGDVDAAGEQGVEGTLVRCARYAWYLGHADALGANGDQIRECASDLDAHAHRALPRLAAPPGRQPHPSMMQLAAPPPSSPDRMGPGCGCHPQRCGLLLACWQPPPLSVPPPPDARPAALGVFDHAPMPSKISGSWNHPPLCSTDRKVPMAPPCELA